MDFYERYCAYIKSDWWKLTRDQIIQRDHNTCQCCGRPFDLHVHHLSYEHLGYEKDYELITLCKSCHEWIEEKKEARKQSLKFDLLGSGQLNSNDQMELINARKNFLNGKSDSEKTASEIWNEFIDECYKKDLSAGGPLNLCVIDVIKDFYSSFCKEHHYVEYNPHTMDVQRKLSQKRYSVIINYIDHGYPQYVVKQRTGFSNRMINNVFENYDYYKNLLKEERNS